jgi:hypothetical protein
MQLIDLFMYSIKHVACDAWLFPLVKCWPYVTAVEKLVH